MGALGIWLGILGCKVLWVLALGSGFMAFGLRTVGFKALGLGILGAWGCRVLDLNSGFNGFRA